jgi:hypothetical protein
MLSTEMSFAAGGRRCEVPARCGPLGGASRVSDMSTVGPLLLFAVGALILTAAPSRLASMVVLMLPGRCGLD